MLAGTELIVVIFLGLVSVATAYTSFQSSLYGGTATDRKSRSEAKATEAESRYQEGDALYVLDTQTLHRLTELRVQRESADPIVAADAAAIYDELYFVAVSDDLDTAIERAAALDESEPDYWHDPQADEDYQASLYGLYGEIQTEADALRAEGVRYGGLADLLGFYTALMAVTLFLLGIAAVIQRLVTRWILIGVGMSLFTATAVAVSFVPFMWIVLAP